LLSKICVWAPDRTQALARMRRALGECVVTGLSTNLDLLERLVASAGVESGDYDTTFVERELASLLASEPERAHSDATLAAAAAAFAAQRDATAAPKRAETTLSPWVLAERAGRLEK
jgi:acetyl/propionyl-CoA carboxylase alpha subunit